MDPTLHARYHRTSTAQFFLVLFGKWCKRTKGTLPFPMIFVLGNGPGEGTQLGCESIDLNTWTSHVPFHHRPLRWGKSAGGRADKIGHYLFSSSLLPYPPSLLLFLIFYPCPVLFSPSCGNRLCVSALFKARLSSGTFDTFQEVFLGLSGPGRWPIRTEGNVFCCCCYPFLSLSLSLFLIFKSNSFCFHGCICVKLSHCFICVCFYFD